LGVDPKCVAIRLALASLGQGDHPRCLSYLHDLIENHCVDADVYILCSKIYISKEDVLNAVEYVRIATKLNKDHPEILQLKRQILKYANGLKNKANVELHRRDLNAAFYYLNQVVQLDEDDWKSKLLFAIVIGELGDWERAIAELMDVLGVESRDGDRESVIRLQISNFHNKVAVRLYEEEKYTQALERFAVAINFCSKDTLVRKNMAECLIMMKSFDKALNELQICLELEPTDEDCKQRLGYLYSTQSKTLVQRKEYAKAITALTNVFFA
jgi:tetratricopeptide (TPR) repeat protein